MAHPVTDHAVSVDAFYPVVGAALSPTLLLDSGGRLLYWNRPAEHLFGDTLRAGWPIAAALSESEAPDHPFRQFSATALNGAVVELTLTDPDGRSLWTDAHLSLFEAITGPVLWCTLTAQAEADSGVSRAELERRTNELERANQALVMYAEVVSHEIRAPLRAIRNYADFLDEDLCGQLGDEQAEHLDCLREAAGQAERLVEDVLRLSQPTAGHDEHDQDVRALLEELLRTLPLPPDVEVAIDDELPSVVGSAALLRQIFQNLLTNAVKFNESSPKRVEIGGSLLDNGECMLHVRDNGIGIDAQHQQKVFDVFHRLHGRDRYDGTGIGLALVEQAATRLGGAVHVKSAAGCGATFYVRLRAAVAE